MYDQIINFLKGRGLIQVNTSIDNNPQQSLKLKTKTSFMNCNSLPIAAQKIRLPASTKKLAPSA